MDWYRERAYTHFDRPIGEAKANGFVPVPSEVARHAFYPLIHVDIPRRRAVLTASGVGVKNKPRPIRYAAHADAHIYAYYAAVLAGPYENNLTGTGISDVVLAFRSSVGKSNVDFARDAFLTIQRTGPCVALAFDVEDFFGSLDHAQLKEAWRRHIPGTPSRLPPDHYAVFRSVTKYAWVDRSALLTALDLSKYNPRKNGVRIATPEVFRDTVRAAGLIQRNTDRFGIPQGLPISAGLSNIYLLDADVRINKAVAACFGAYWRYCDDILCVVPTQSADDIRAVVNEALTTAKLRINSDKTKISNFFLKSGQLTCDQRLQYLGFVFDGQQVAIRASSTGRFFRNMRTAVEAVGNGRERVNRLRVVRGHGKLPLYRRRLFSRYSHLGRRNFVRYALRAAKAMAPLDSSPIRNQVRRGWYKLLAEMHAVAG